MSDGGDAGPVQEFPEEVGRVGVGEARGAG